MTIDVYTATGSKKGTATLPKTLFEAAINEGLIHQAVVRQQSNRRNTVSHTKGRGEIKGSTRKLYAQKGTGRARRGQVRSSVVRGGNKAFGPLKNANYTKEMPKKMRRNALFACLSLQANNGAIIGLESYPKEVKTKKMMDLLKKLPVDIGRKILFVIPEKHPSLTLSTSNIPEVKTILAQYLNPEDVLRAQHIVFLVEAIAKTEEIFTTKETKTKEVKEKKPKAASKPTVKTTAKKKTSPSKK